MTLCGHSAPTDRHGAGVRRKAALDVQRLPRALGFVLGDEVAVLGRRAEGRHVAGLRNRAADVDQREPDRAADRRVAVGAGAERVVAAVDAEFARDRAVDDHQRRAQMGGGLHAVEVELLLAHRLDGEHVERKIFGTAARHHRVGGEPQWRRLAPARRNFRDRFIPRTVAVGEHLLDARVGRRHDRQAVGPAALEIERVDRFEIVVGVDARAFGFQQVGEIAHDRLSLISLITCGIATSARPCTCSIDRPPKRMRDHHQRQVGRAEHARLRRAERAERVRADHRGEHAAFMHLGHVVDTPRRAGPSIGHRADDHVGFRRQLCPAPPWWRGR